MHREVSGHSWCWNREKNGSRPCSNSGVAAGSACLQLQGVFVGLREAVRILGAQRTPCPLLSLHLPFPALPVGIPIWTPASSKQGGGRRLHVVRRRDVKREALFVLWERLAPGGSAGGRTCPSHLEIVRRSGAWTAAGVTTSLFDGVGTPCLEHGAACSERCPSSLSALVQMALPCPGRWRCQFWEPPAEGGTDRRAGARSGARGHSKQKYGFAILLTWKNNGLFKNTQIRLLLVRGQTAIVTTEMSF